MPSFILRGTHAYKGAGVGNGAAGVDQKQGQANGWLIGQRQTVEGMPALSAFSGIKKEIATNAHGTELGGMLGVIHQLPTVAGIPAPSAFRGINNFQGGGLPSFNLLKSRKLE